MSTTTTSTTAPSTAGTSQPVTPVTVSVPLTVEQLDVLVDALQDADDYRQNEGGCGFCAQARGEADDDDAECEDHASDRAKGDRYAALATVLKDVRRPYL